jgi:hypothetical protein
MPLEGTGMFFLPPSSTDLPLFGFSAEFAENRAALGVQSFRAVTTFHHLPPQVEGREKNLSQQPRGLQRITTTDLPLIPHMQGDFPPHWFFENPYGRHLPS